MTSQLKRLVLTLACGSLLFLGSTDAGIIRFNAVIDAEQETTGSDSIATGTAVLVYDVTTNRFDLVITIEDLENILTLSHIHEGAPGVAGPPVVDFGVAEANYTRDGNTITATFANWEYEGDPEALLSGNAYLNYHTADWTGGEVRGQLIPEPVKLTAIMDPESERGPTPVDSDAYGAVQATYDPMTNMITTLVCAYNFTNTLTDSHIHEAGVEASGPPTLPFGGAANYTNSGTTYVTQFGPEDYPGSPVALLSEGAYVNVHSNIYGPGEIRGQLYVSNSQNAGRLVNVSARAAVGTGDDVLISGFFINGTEPVRVLVTARGPSFADLLDGTLEDPMLAVRDNDGNLLLDNDSVGDAPFSELIEAFTDVSFTDVEAGVLLVLPPGGYTVIVSGADEGTGVGLAEAFEVSW